jgi:hypothetical protein
MIKLLSVVLIVVLSDYVLTMNYKPRCFNREMLLQKKYRCIRYFDDTSGYNKHMEKTCLSYKNDYALFKHQKKVLSIVSIISSLFCAICIYV